MDAILLHGSFDQSPNKSHIQNPKKIMHQPFFPSNNTHSLGLLQTPPLFPYHHRKPPPQPPLLPLPTAHHRLSGNTKKNDARTLKKSNGSATKSTPNKQKKKRPPKRSVSVSSGVTSGTNPNAVPKNVARVSSSSSDSTVKHMHGGENYYSSIAKQFEDSLVFTVSPPPSSLPLPRFCLRPKHHRDAV